MEAERLAEPDHRAVRGLAVVGEVELPLVEGDPGGCHRRRIEELVGELPAALEGLETHRLGAEWHNGFQAKHAALASDVDGCEAALLGRDVADGNTPVGAHGRNGWAGSALSTLGVNEGEARLIDPGRQAAGDVADPPAGRRRDTPLPDQARRADDEVAGRGEEHFTVDLGPERRVTQTTGQLNTSAVLVQLVERPTVDQVEAGEVERGEARRDAPSCREGCEPFAAGEHPRVVDVHVVGLLQQLPCAWRHALPAGDAAQRIGLVVQAGEALEHRPVAV